MAYCTVADVKTYLGVSEADDDALIATLINAAQAAIDAHTGNTFEAAVDAVRYYDVHGPHIEGRRLYFDRPLASLTSISDGGGAYQATDYVMMPRNDAPYYGVELKLTTGRFWTYVTDWENAIAVTGRWAYSVSAPNDIRQAARRLAAFYYRQKDAPLQDVTAIEAGVVVQPIAMPADVRALLSPYRAPVVL